MQLEMAALYGPVVRGERYPAWVLAAVATRPPAPEPRRGVLGLLRIHSLQQAFRHLR
jgi:hypothetical protein